LGLAVLFFASVVALSASRVQNITAYLSLLSLSYFASSFIFRPKGRMIDLVGIGLLYYNVLFLVTALRVL
jgi:hypothetical protein